MPLPGGRTPPDAGDAVAVALRDATAQIEDALDHYQIGYDTMAWGLPVRWQYVAQQMAEALGRAQPSGTQPPDSRAHQPEQYKKS